MRPTLLISLALLSSVAACGGGEPPHWIALASSLERGAAPSSLRLANGSEVELTLRDGAVWGSVRVPRDAWKPVRKYAVVSTPAPLLVLGLPEYELELDGKPCRRVTPASGNLRVAIRAFEAGTFACWRGAIYLGMAPGAAPPESALLSVRLVAASSADGEGLPLFEGRRFTGRGFAPWPGERVERVLDVAEERALCFGTASEPLSALDPPGTQHVFRVFADGALLFEHEQACTTDGGYAWHSVRVPAGRGVRLAFEVEGPFAYTAFVDPVLAPAAHGSYAARPWSAPPSIVVFLADTFRADNLASYGGEPAVTPELDRFAAASLRFARAWSPATFTLPGHASLFSGLFPRQTALDALGLALPEEIETIAEVLSRAGYRTGAITDSALVSRRFGLHQGFHWFDECDIDLASTLARARAFLDADDGRPVFLFVHTYRAHLPYGGAEEPAIPGIPNVRPGDEFQALMTRLQALGGPLHAFEREPERARAVGRDMLALYRRGAHDLDQHFGEFWRDLEARGFPGAGYLVFTSDHGEAFFEHGEFAHEGHVFEEQIRIPLLLAGPGVSARVVEHPASLVDLPPTLGAIAGLPPRAQWRGTNLLTLDRDRPLYAFECAERETSTVAVIEDGHKLIALEETAARKLREPWRAFDLAGDPLEARDLLAGHAEAWPAALYRDAAARVAELLVPLVTPAAAALDADRAEQLDDLGYTDGDH